MKKTIISSLLFAIYFSVAGQEKKDSCSHKGIGISLGMQFYNDDKGLPYYIASTRYKNSISEAYVHSLLDLLPLFSVKYIPSNKFTHEIGARYRDGEIMSHNFETNLKELSVYYQLQIFPFRKYFNHSFKPFFGLKATYKVRNIFAISKLDFMTDTYSDKSNLYIFNIPVGLRIDYNNFYFELEGNLNFTGYVTGSYVTHGTNLTRSSVIDERGQYSEPLLFNKLAKNQLVINTINLKIGYFLNLKSNKK